MRQLLMADANVAVSFITSVELQSAIARRSRDDEPDARQAASAFVSALQQGWTVADEYEPIVALSTRLAARHRLRGADAIQLASAMAIGGSGGGMTFVALDDELAAAARAEGFPVLP